MAKGYLPLNGVEAARRAHLRGLVAGAAGLAGCGGGGGGGTTAPEAGNQPAASTGTPIPPESGAFGGGAGKILYVEAAETPNAIKELDLTTRRIRTVITLQRDEPFWEFTGGVSRAGNGTFALMDQNDSLLSDKSTIYIHSDDGALIRAFPLKRANMHSVAISPSGQYVVYAWADTRNPSSRWTSDNYLIAGVIDIASGLETEIVLLGDESPPSDKSGYSLSACPVWLSDTAFYVMFRRGHVRVDLSSGEVIKTLDDSLPGPEVAALAPGRDEIWFQTNKGNPYGATIWPLSLADRSMKRRSMRSESGGQYSPAFSPDGQWLLMQERHFLTGIIGAGSSTLISAVRHSAEPIDTEELDIWLRDASGRPLLALDRMAWY